MKTALIGIVVLGALFVSSPRTAWAMGDDQVHQAIEDKLSERHPQDSAAAWQSLGSDAVPVIISMYGSTDYISHRVRLAQALGYFDDARAVDFLEKLAQSSGEDVVVNSSLRALGNSPRDVGEEDFISKFLKNDDPQTRLAAAEALNRIIEKQGDSHARDMLAAFLLQEKQPWIVSRVKGEQVKATGLKAVSSSEDRLSQDFAGTWRGFWVQPKDGAKGMSSDPISLELKTLDDNTVQGSLFVTTGMKSKTLTLLKSSGKGQQISGSFKDDAASDEFDAFLSRTRDQLILQIKVPNKAAILILRKES
jgi:hypothetical protein